MGRVLLEVCVDSLSGHSSAVIGKADRIEVCSALELGGLSPAWSLFKVASGRGRNPPAMAMIRPRAGDFVWSMLEGGGMMAEIEAARAAGFAGVVIGASRPDGTLDLKVLEALVGAADGLDVTLHRCFDLAPDPFEALEQAVSLGIRRVLTSGGAARAPDALDRLAALHEAARGRIVVMPGSGIRPDNVRALLAAAPFTEVHASCSEPVTQDPRTVRMGFATAVRREARPLRVRALREVLDAA